MVKWVTPTRITLASTMTTTTRKTMSTRSFLTIVIVIASLVRVINGFLPIQLNAATGRAISSSGTDARKLYGGYRITPKHCRATKTLSHPRSNGPTICMFNHECAQRNGEVVGACMDGFLFGACCQIPNLQQVDSTLINDAQNAYFQQYQQQKMQMQHTISNPIAAQSYENYGESAQQSMEVSNTDQQTNNYHTTKYDDFTTISSYSAEPAPSSSTASITTDNRLQEYPTTSLISSTQSEEVTDSEVKPQFNRKKSNSARRPSTASKTSPTIKPPRINIHKDSVVISSPSSPSYNDDYIMPVLSTLPPDNVHDLMTFTTEVPMKIATYSEDRFSSESNSFEEENTVTDTTVRVTEKPIDDKETTQPEQQTSTSAHETLHHQDEPQYHSQETSNEHQSSHDQEQKYPSKTHNHNHLLLDVNELTHSDITHPGTNADLVDDLQFSSGYGAQPTIIDPTKQNTLVSSYDPDSNIKTTQPDDKYVLVQTFSNDQSHKQSMSSSIPTTDSSITTHVDSIESIILQLNNTNTGPVYSVIDQNDQSYDPSTTLSLHSDSVTYTDNQDSYNGSKTSSVTTSVKPLEAAPTQNPTNYFEEIETKRPEDFQQEKYTSMTDKVPAYLEPVTTNLNYATENEYAADFLSESSSLESTAYQPEEASSDTTLNDATMPNKNYNDVADAGHQTSEFNKMPVIGIAYPVDMSYMEEDGSLNAEDSGYQKLSTQTSSQIPLQTSTTMETYNSEPEESSTQTETSYTRLPAISYTTSQTNKRPAASYIGVATPANHNQQPQVSSYNQVPEEVSVTSHTTKIQQDLDSTAYETAQTQKLTTISYVDTTVTTSKPHKTKPSKFSYTTSQSTTATGPTYDNLVLSSSTAKPKPSKRPGLGNTKKTTKPHVTKRPSTNNNTKAPQNNFQQGNYQSTPNKATSTSFYTKAPQNDFQQGNYQSPPTKATPTTFYTKAPQNDFQQGNSQTTPNKATPTSFYTKAPQNDFQEGNYQLTPNKATPSFYTKAPQNDFQQGNSQKTTNKATPTSSYGTSVSASYNHEPTEIYAHQSSAQNTQQPNTQKQPTKDYSSLYAHQSSAQKQPTKDYSSLYAHQSSAQKQPTNDYSSLYAQQTNTQKQPTKDYSSLYAQQSNTQKQPSNDYSSLYAQQQNTQKQPTNDYSLLYAHQSSAQKQPTNDYSSLYAQQPNTQTQPTKDYSSLYVQQSSTQKQPSNDYNSPNAHQSSTQKQPSNDYSFLVTKLSQGAVQQRPSSTTYKVPSQPSLSYNQQQLGSSPPAKKTATQKPSTNKRPISTSYISGPTTVRAPTTSAYDHEVPPLIIANDKLDSFIHSTSGSLAGSPPVLENSYLAPIHASAATPLQIQGTYNGHKKPVFIKIRATTRRPVPTVIITPKPTTNTYVKQPSADYNSPDYRPPTTSSPQFASTSYIYSPTITRRPDITESTSENVSLPPVSSNDFYDPGYFGSQAATRPTYAIPSDDRPAFPGYFGPTPTYPAFQIPGEKNDGSIEETYTSPNDFVNFPPVRNPNLNMSATSSAVTSDLELSTPAFVEDGILKDKMNTLVHKIVESLQGNFEALADIIDENGEPSTYQAAAGTTTTTTRKPTRKPVSTKTKPTTKKPVTRSTTKPPTRKPTVTTRKPVSKRTTTKKPVTTRRPTKKTTPTTTTVAPLQDEIIDEEDGEDINLSDNEIGQSDSLGVGASGRQIQCGMRPHVKSGRIVGGKGSTFGAYPWQVLVRESTWLGLFTKNKCGGVLITNKYIITAAHCQPGFLASLVAVMGEFDISGDLESKKAVTKNVKRVIVHRQYDPATFENDLALLELESPVQFDTHIVPICMPKDTADFTGRMATVTGWGRLKYGGGVPSVLQEVQVPIIENSVCQEMFHTAGHNKKILNSFLCAGYANGQKDSCEGDSGGPLVLQRPDGRYELAGTVSHGIKCAAPYLPGVYMRTTYYKPWLRSITGVK